MEDEWKSKIPTAVASVRCRTAAGGADDRNAGAAVKWRY
jgi:hypothetical protein